MVINNKIFKLSSLCIMGTIAVIMNQTNSAKNNMNMDTMTTNAGTQTSVVVDEETNSGDNSNNAYTEVLKRNGVSIEEEEVPKDDKPEATEEASKEEKTPLQIIQESKVIKGAVKGVNYKNYINYDKYKNLGVAAVAQYLNVRKGAGKKYEVVGKMPPNAGCTIIKEVPVGKETWCYIKSGDVTGYVNKMYLTTGDDALALVHQVGRLVIKVDCDTLNIREKASTDSDVLYQISKGEELEIVSINKDWIEVNVDVGQETAFVSSEYVKVSFELIKAIEIDEILHGCSAQRSAIVAFAKNYLGNRYVYGGTSLTKGIDCSGFMMRIYEHFGYKITRTSRSQATQGKQITSEQLKPGDLVFYVRGSSVSSIYHVAMYIGNNKIIHASNPRSGIKISNMYYTKPCRYVSILND